LSRTSIEIIKRTIGSGEDVLVSGFGKCCVKNKGQRRGRIPASGSSLMLSAQCGNVQTLGQIKRQTEQIKTHTMHTSMPAYEKGQDRARFEL